MKKEDQKAREYTRMTSEDRLKQKNKVLEEKQKKLEKAWFARSMEYQKELGKLKRQLEEKNANSASPGAEPPAKKEKKETEDESSSSSSAPVQPMNPDEVKVLPSYSSGKNYFISSNILF